MEITDTDRINFLKKSMGKFDTGTRYRKNSWMAEEEFMLTFLDKDNNYKMSTSTSLEEAIDKAILQSNDNVFSSVDHIPHSL